MAFRARRGQIEAVLSFGTRSGFARGLARTFSTRLGIRCAAALGSAFTTASAAAAPTASATTPALAAISAISAIPIVALRAARALGSLSRRLFSCRFGLRRRCLRLLLLLLILLAILRMATAALRAFAATSL
jgi:hypothetical protein